MGIAAFLHIVCLRDDVQQISVPCLLFQNIEFLYPATQ